MKHEHRYLLKLAKTVSRLIASEAGTDQRQGCWLRMCQAHDDWFLRYGTEANFREYWHNAPIGEVEESLRADGIDPEAVADRVETLVANELDKHRRRIK